MDALTIIVSVLGGLALFLYGMVIPCAEALGIPQAEWRVSEEYLRWLEQNGWYVTFSKEMAARIALMYTECKS